MALNNESAISKVTTIRLSNEAREKAEAEFTRKGYRNLAAYLRSLLEHVIMNDGILCQVGEKAEAALAKRAKDKGWANMRDYCTALLRTFALPDEPIKKSPKKRARK